MSYTEIYVFGADGDARLHSRVHNSYRGGWAIWRTMEERYLPIYKLHGIEISRLTADAYDGKDPLDEIWALADDPKVPEHERIVLASTFDRCLVKKKNIPKVIEAFRKFEGCTSLPEQADILEKLVDDEDCIAVGWNQTSVNCAVWATLGGYDKEKGAIPYNCFTGEQHQWLFREENDE